MVEYDLLLSPISDAKPTGVYLKGERTTYRAMRNSYNAAQSSFRQLIETPDASSNRDLWINNQNNWQQLQKVTQDALIQSTKDFELLGWFITSQVFTPAAFENLAGSAKLLVAFVKRFWLELHPSLHEVNNDKNDLQSQQKESVELNIKSLLRFIGESHETTAIFMPLQLISLVESVTYGDFVRAKQADELTELKGKVQSLFSDEVKKTVLFLSETYQHFVETESFIGEQCNQLNVRPVSFRFVKANIADLINSIEFLVGDLFPYWPLDANFCVQQPLAEPKEELQKIDETGSLNLNKVTKDSVAEHEVSPTNLLQKKYSRQQAFKELRRISQFFKKTEPHSPIPFLIERAIRWGHASLPELLQEMTGGGDSVMNHINQLTGMDNLEEFNLQDAQPSISSDIYSYSEYEADGGAVNSLSTPVTSPAVKDSSNNETSEIDEGVNHSSGRVNGFSW